MDVSEDESIESFLHRLKLSETYLQSFLRNGYAIVKDCEGMTEETLKSIGVTLPGHYRRIMSQLSGISLPKPPMVIANDAPKTTLEEQSTPALQYSERNSEQTGQGEMEATSISGKVTDLQHVLFDEEIHELSGIPTEVDGNAYEWSTSSALPLTRKEMTSSVIPELLLPLSAPSPECLLEDNNCNVNNPYGTFQADHIPDFSYEKEAKNGKISEINQTKLNEEDKLEIRHDHHSWQSLQEDQSHGYSENEYDHILLGETPLAHARLSDSMNCLSGPARKCNTANGVYDMLNSKILPVCHKTLSCETSPSYLSPHNSTFHSRKTSETSEIILDLIPGENHLCPIPVPWKDFDKNAASNKSLPPHTWQDAIECKDADITDDSRSVDPYSVIERPESSSPGTKFTTPHHLPPDLYTSFEDGYTSLLLGPHDTYNPKSFAGKDDVVGQYEIAKNSNLNRNCTTPLAPHNTPSRSTVGSQYDVEENKQDSSSYADIEFFPGVAPYSSLRDNAKDNDGFDHSHSAAQSSKEKGGKSAYRRLTGMQSHLQKAAKAAMKKHMPKRKGFPKTSQKCSLETAICHSDDNDSFDSPIRKGSMDDGNTTEIIDFQVGLTTNAQRSLIDMARSPATSSLTGAERQTNTGYISAVTPRVLSDTGAFEFQENTYEDLRDEARSMHEHYSNDMNIPPILRTRMKKSSENMARRPVSVFADSRFSGIEQTSRDRTSSATLSLDINLRTHHNEGNLDQYGDAGGFIKQTLPTLSDESPLAKKRTKSGWLWKHGGHDGRAPLRKRWVVFDGDELIYYESDSKKDFSKGVIPVDVMLRVQIPQNDSLIFHLQTKGGRKYIFQAEDGNERAVWTSTLMAAIMMFEQTDRYHQFKPGGNMYMPYKDGLLKMDGIRQKVYFAIKGEYAAYYKNKSEFQFAQPVTRLQMKLATVKDVDKKKFQIVFPYRTFTLTAESEEEKQSWIESLLEGIAEGLSDYQVLDEIWINEANKKCADCGRGYPDWSSINLAIVICRHCAGVHRELGVHNSKVRSLKMDIKIWDPVMKRLLLDVGNDGANEFWANKLSNSETINDMADKKQRAWFVKEKYIDMSYANIHPEAGDQELINQSLIEAVRNNHLIEAYRLTFSGADLNCSTGKEHAKTPLLLSKFLKHIILAEFLRQNGATDAISPVGHITERSASVRKKDHTFLKPRSKPPLSLRDCLHKYGGDFKEAVEDKGKGKISFIISVLQPGDFQKRLCILENNILKYCDPEKPNVIKDYISCHDLISITVHTPEQAVKAGYQYCFELSRASGRTYLFCASNLETLRRWTMGLLQAILPPFIQDVMQPKEDYDRVGKMNIKSIRYSQSNMGWSPTWCHLRKKSLNYFDNEAQTTETIDLRKLVQIVVDQTQEITTRPQIATQNKETIPVIMLVFRDRSYHLYSDTRPDTESWMAALQRSDNLPGETLQEMQLTADGVPTILEKCIAFVEQYGIRMRGIYRLSGTHSKTTQLLHDFRRNARETQMRQGDINVHDVANALKRWFKSLPGSLLTEELHLQWTETAEIKEEHLDTKLNWYKYLIENLPEINRMTLKVLLQHLQNVSRYEQENEMSIHNIAIVFGPTLLEPADEESGRKYIGHTSHEICCIEDLLRFYDWLFDITETDRKKEEVMQIAKTKIDTAHRQKNMVTTLDYDMMVPIYINRKEDTCVNYKVNLSADELVKKVCGTQSFAENCGLYEVILNGEAERPLHYTEHVLGVIKSWCTPSTNYLVVKNDFMRGRMRWLKEGVTQCLDTIIEGTLRTFDGKKKWTKVTGSIRRTDGTPYFECTKSTTEASQMDIITSASGRKRSVKTRSKGWSRLGHFNDTSAKTVVSLEIRSIKVYVGVDKKTKPPGNGRQGFTVIHIEEDHPKYFIAEDEEEMFRWTSCMLLCMHPDGFTPPMSPVATPSKPHDHNRKSKSDTSAKRSVSQELSSVIPSVITELRRSPSKKNFDDAWKRIQDTHFEGPSGSGIHISPQARHNSRVTMENMLVLKTEQSQEQGYIRNETETSIESNPADVPIQSNMLPMGTESRRPLPMYALSPGDPQHQPRTGLGIELRDELSTVLRKRTQ